MANTQQLKLRIRSVGSTRQITRAMQLVAASKMRRAQDAEKASVPYVRAASELLSYFASQGATDLHPLFEHRDVKSRLLIVIAADKGLAGAYNSNILKLYLKELESSDEGGIATKSIAIGRRAARFMARIKGAELIGAYEDLPDQPSERQVQAILDTAIDMFQSGEVDAVDVVYTDFKTSIRQDAVVKPLLPAGFAKTEVSESISEAKYEPSIPEVLSVVTRRLVAARLFQAMLDARASEHSMRMLAMKNATDNASDLIDDLTLEMNKARQGAITQELTEISSGVEAVS